jgi:hypothetical protein
MHIQHTVQQYRHYWLYRYAPCVSVPFPPCAPLALGVTVSICLEGEGQQERWEQCNDHGAPVRAGTCYRVN